MAWTAISTRNETPPIARGGWLDLLRFIVASLIILHHFQMSAPVPLAEGLHPVFERGGFLLTNFFLIDSGYVLMRVYGPAVGAGRMSPADFFAKRALRVFPAHLMMGLALAAFVALSTLAGFGPRNPEWFAWDQLPAQLGLVQAFGVHGGLGWNAPSWSVSALLGCYLAFPWILKALRPLGGWSALIGVAALYFLANELAWTLFGLPVYQMPLGLGFWRALPLFVLGMGLAMFTERVWVSPKLARVVLAAAAVALAVIQNDGKHALASLVCISLILLAAGAIPVVRPSRWIEKAAVVSFSMFITNEVVRIVWFGAVNAGTARLGLAEPVQWMLWGLGVVVAFGFAFAFHMVIDDPVQTRIKAWLKRRSARPAVVTRPVVSLEG